MATERETWLALTMEDPLDPELPICDAHHHVYYRPNKRYSLEDFLYDVGGGHNIIQTVFIEAKTMYREGGSVEMRPIGETEFVQGVTAQSASGQYGKTRVASGIVGFADLTLGSAVAPVLEAHIAAGGGRFRGIRQIACWDASPDLKEWSRSKGLLLDSKFREGFAYLHKYRLIFDAAVFHPQLMELVDLAKAFLEIPIVLQHSGSPIGIGPYAGKHEEVLQEWKHGMAALATCPNAFVKLIGLGGLRFGLGWYTRDKPPSSAEVADAIAPYYQWCIEQFGVDRCMLGSNFPPDKISYSYTILWNAFKRLSEDLLPEDRVALFHNTAAKVYRLETKYGGLERASSPDVT